MRKAFFVIPAALTLCATFARPIAADEGFDRAQTMVVNLNRVAGSTGFYLLQDIRLIKTMDHDLAKAVRQVQEVDHTYARLRGRTDEKFLEAVSIKIQKAQTSRALFEEDLKDAYTQLKSSVEDTMMTDNERKNAK